MGSVIHETVPVRVWVDVDLGIAEDVRWLNSLPGVRTFASCQGTIGEGGPAPYPAQIMAWWPDEHDAAIKKRFDVGEKGNGWAYLHPRRPAIQCEKFTWCVMPLGHKGGCSSTKYTFVEPTCPKCIEAQSPRRAH
jgi:hypothetical protein